MSVERNWIKASKVSREGIRIKAQKRADLQMSDFTSKIYYVVLK